MLDKIDIEKIIEIAKLAGKEILKIYNQDFEIYSKNDKSPLTDADKNANELIVNKLEELYPEITIISEENNIVSYSERKKWQYCWIIDPLDGTKEFIKKNDEFTVNIALVKNGKPILGVVYLPVLDVFYYAIESKGSFKRKNCINKKLLKKENKTNKIKVIASRSHLSSAVLDYVEKLKQQDKEVEFISAGSSLKFCLVAENKADIYPRLAPTMEWDTAAAHIVCTEAGFRVYSFETNKELFYNKEELLNPWFIVS